MGWLYQRRRRRGPSEDSAIVLDTFSRDDSAVSLGTSDSGHEWTAHKGTWGISGGKAYCAVTDTSQEVATVDAGINAGIRIALTIPNTLGQPALIFRYVDANNFWRWWKLSPTELRIDAILAGVENPVVIITHSLADGDELALEIGADEESMEFFVNGVSKDTHSNTALQASTRFGPGFNTASTSARFGPFRITAL